MIKKAFLCCLKNTAGFHEGSHLQDIGWDLQSAWMQIYLKKAGNIYIHNKLDNVIQNDGLTKIQFTNPKKFDSKVATGSCQPSSMSNGD